MSHPPRQQATVLVLGTGLFGSKICTLLHKLCSAHSRVSSSTIAPFRVTVAGRRPRVAANIARLLADEQKKQMQHQNENNKEASPSFSSSSSIITFASADASVDASSPKSLRAALQLLRPHVVVNATGLHHRHLDMLTWECLEHGASLVDISEHGDAADRIEEAVKRRKKYLQSQRDGAVFASSSPSSSSSSSSSRPILCATGISTSPLLTSAAVNHLLDDFLIEYKNLSNSDEELKGVSAPEDKSYMSYEQQFQDFIDQQQAARTDKEISVEIALCPAMGAVPKSCSRFASANFTTGSSTLAAVVSRIGTRYDVWRGGKVEYAAGDWLAFRSIYKYHMPPPIGHRLVSPFPSPDFRIGSCLFATQASMDREERNQALFRSRHDPAWYEQKSVSPDGTTTSVSTSRLIDSSYGEDFVTIRSIRVGNAHQRVREVSFVAGLGVPLLHRLAALVPDKARAAIMSFELRNALFGIVFRLCSLGGGRSGSGGLTVKVTQHMDEMSGASMRSRFRRDELPPATARTMLICGHNGAGVFLPALPAAMLVLRLMSELHPTTSYSSSSSSSVLDEDVKRDSASDGDDENKSNDGNSTRQTHSSSFPQQQQQQQQIVFFNGVLRREWLDAAAGPVPPPHPAILSLTMPEIEKAMVQVFPASIIGAAEQSSSSSSSSLLSSFEPLVKIETSSCLFEFIVGRQKWNERVNPAVRLFHDTNQATAWCEDSLYRHGKAHDRRDRRFCVFNALVYSPEPASRFDRAVLKVLQLPHNYPKWTQFRIECIVDPFEETWVRHYPTVRMETTLKATEVYASSSRVVKKRATWRSWWNQVFGGNKKQKQPEIEKALIESLFGGLVELVHRFTVDEKDGSLYYNVVGMQILYGKLTMPQFLVPKAKVRESQCKQTGKFKFQIQVKLPIVGTTVQYTGTVAPNKFI